MKQVLLPVMVVALAAATIPLGSHADTTAMSNEDAWARIVGDWVNPEYSGAPPYSQRLVFGADLQMTDCPFVDGPNTLTVASIKPKKSWTDGDGNVYCQVYFRYVVNGTTDGLALFRVDSLGKVFEANWILGAPEEGSLANFALKYLDSIDPQLPTKTPLKALYCKYLRR
jgi:hypothetical protein